MVFDRPWKNWKVITAFPTGEEIPAETLEWLMNYARENATPLLFYSHMKVNDTFGSVKRTGYGPPAFVHEVKTQIDPTVDILSLAGQ